MTDDDADDLRALLSLAAPHDTGRPASERASAVVARGHRSRRRRTAGVAAAALVLVGSTVAGLLLNDGEVPASTVARDPAPPAGVLACPDAPSPVPAAADWPDGGLAAVVCPGPPTPGGIKNDRLKGLPREPLTENVEDFLAEIRSLPDYEPGRVCDRINYFPESWLILVRYAETTSVAGSPSRICAPVEINGRQLNSSTVLTAYVDAVRTQRAERDGVPQPTCSRTGLRFQPLEVEPNTWTGPLADFEPVTGRICYAMDPPGTPEFYRAEGGLPSKQVDFLFDKLVRERTQGPASTLRCADYGPNRTLVFLDAEGRSMSLIDEQCSGEFIGADGRGWTPGAQAENALAAALGGRIGVTP